MEIRLARPEEATRALEILTICGTEMHDRFGVPDWVLPGVAGIVASDAVAARLYLVSHDGGAIGTFTLCDEPDAYFGTAAWSDAQGTAIYLHRFAILPGQQSQGLGARCMQFMEQLAVRRRREWIRLDALKLDPRSRAFYERSGFADRGVAYIPVPLDGYADVEVICYERRVSHTG